MAIMALFPPRRVWATRSFSLLLYGLMLCGLPHLEALEEGDPCTLKGNLPGVCQGASECEPRIKKYIETRRLTVNDIPTCGLGLREEIVCCPVSECCGDDQRTETTPKSPEQRDPLTRTDVPRPAVQACRLIEKREVEEPLTSHILGGIPVDPAYYPHMAAIAFNELGNIRFGCGGSLISTRFVLTAAHCVNSQDQIPVYVRLGTVDIANVGAHYQDINVTSNIRVHPEYLSTSKYNDIAILELAEEAKLNNYTYPACLETDLADPPENANLYVAGWGIMNKTTRRTSKILLRAPLTVVPLDKCNDSFSEQPSSQRYLKKGIIDTLLCAADVIQGEKDACQGDSGGPLVLERDKPNNKYSIMGVISSGFGCATPTPGLYTRVASFLDFIEGIVWPNGFA
ncbi:serine protease persephone-like isoform X2 [Drosophila hydei]|uniref:Serine protease persephone-like isoform X2 n=1 Tax=Drosophila hydei TaxID=7224 RepID=A0A6J1MH04_DROHY|nr:serine protease persephone-like isoform X2 [Drosophila hydei]